MPIAVAGGRFVWRAVADGLQPAALGEARARPYPCHVAATPGAQYGERGPGSEATPHVRDANPDGSPSRRDRRAGDDCRLSGARPPRPPARARPSASAPPRSPRPAPLARRTVIVRHGLRHAMLPVVTILGIGMGRLIAGSVIIEVVFAWPGVGRLIIDSIVRSDYPMVQAAIIVLAASISLADVLSLREREFVLAARSIGARDRRVLARHVLPNLINVVVILMTMEVATVILFEAGLSFLNVGVEAGTPSWGIMISEGRNFMPIASWLIWIPGIAIVMIALTAMMIGDWLRDALDPQLRKVR